MVKCLTSARFNMKADILRQGTDNPETTDTNEGEWVNISDPDSGEIIRVWQPAEQTDDPETPEYEGLETFKCMARGVISAGVAAGGTTERFSELYEGADYVRMWLPASVQISKRDRITNIRNRKNKVIWVEEERADRSPTIFSVVGVTPLPDPFGNHVENMAFLERVETQ